MRENKKIKFLLFFTLFLFLSNFFVWKGIFLLTRKPLEVIFFNIGQGDSIFIKNNQGHQILIDGGPDKSILEKIDKELPFWDKTIDLVILTHPEYDHLKGLNYVLEKYKIENILWTGIERETKVFSDWLEVLKKEEEEGAKIFIAQESQKIKAGQIQLNILYPFESLEGQIFKGDSNDSSIVANLLFGENSFLFTGDINQKVEKDILVFDLGSDVLKVAHHGSKNSSSEDFLIKVQPSIAVISCGLDNSYGHPHQDVLNKLENFGIKVLRTDRDGDIKIISNGDELIIDD